MSQLVNFKNAIWTWELILWNTFTIIKQKIRGWVYLRTSLVPRMVQNKTNSHCTKIRRLTYDEERKILELIRTKTIFLCFLVILYFCLVFKVPNEFRKWWTIFELNPDCIFEIHQLWQSGFSKVYSICCCSCSFEREILKIGQSSHKMYSNDILNFQESMPISSLETYWRHHLS